MILPDAFADDPERRARLDREARAGALNHPDNAATCGFEEVAPSPGSGQSAKRALLIELL